MVLCHRRLTPEQIDRVRQGNYRFSHILIRNGRNTEDRTVYFDNLAVFKEEWPELISLPGRCEVSTCFPDKRGPIRVPVVCRSQSP